MPRVRHLRQDPVELLHRRRVPNEVAHLHQRNSIRLMEDAACDLENLAADLRCFNFLEQCGRIPCGKTALRVSSGMVVLRIVGPSESLYNFIITLRAKPGDNDSL